MSISAILSSAYNQPQIGTSTSPYQQSIQQLGKDLQSGNLSAAQSDFASLQAAFAQPSTTTGPSATTTASTASPIAQAFNQLGGDLQSGNLSAAQKDFSTVQQDLQSRGRALPFHGYRISVGPDTGVQNTLLQSLNQIGQSLSSTSLSSAQQAYASLQQELQDFSLGGGATEALNNLPLSLAA
ncbi:MAG: hypothetical protein ABSG02_06220 [Terriglobales bacterium]|jgi:hypothetical protein